MPATPITARNSIYFLSCCIFLNVFFPLIGKTSAEKKLKLVILVIRHGDRTPTQAYPKDLYNETAWPEGFGQLTKLGMEQQYELGKYLKKRYSGFLGETYSSKEVYVRSSDVDRTMMSAQVNLAGLFPPVGRQIWNPDIPWQPIAVHSLPIPDDNMIYIFGSDCPKYTRLKSLTYNSKEYQALVEPYKDFLKFLEINTGYSAQELNDSNTWWILYDMLLCQRIHNYTLPDWYTEEVREKLHQLSDIALAFRMGIYKPLEKSKLLGGVLVNEILANITQATAPPNKRKLIMYVGHDTTLATLHQALNVFNGQVAPYAACHFVELYQHENGTYFIEMYYRNDTTVDPYPLILPGCTLSCPLETFTKLTAPVIVQDWKKECAKPCPLG